MGNVWRRKRKKSLADTIDFFLLSRNIWSRRKRKGGGDEAAAAPLSFWDKTIDTNLKILYNFKYKILQKHNIVLKRKH